MDKATFYRILHNHKELTDAELFALREIIRKFPYFQTARIVYLQILHDQENIHYQEALHLTAAYAADRTHLKNILSQPPLFSPAAEKEEKTVDEPDIYTILTQLQEKVERLLNEKKEEKNKETAVAGKTEVEKQDEVPKQEIKHTFSIEELEDLPPIKTATSEKDQLIDKYLEGEAKEKKPGFYDPAKMARQSLEDRDDIVSETLARLYYEQGYYQKAIKIYRKLILLYPKNSSYFAALIKEIESKS